MLAFARRSGVGMIGPAKGPVGSTVIQQNFPDTHRLAGLGLRNERKRNSSSRF
jgi:hypothetical protein